jgi:hypothetical protein
MKFGVHLKFQLIKHSNHTSHRHLQKSSMRRNYRCWISFTRTRRNSMTQKITSILNWQSISISADMLIYQSMRTKKEFQLCWQMRHWLATMLIEQISSRSMIFALVCEHTSRILNDKVIISINDTISLLRTSLRSIWTSHWLNVFVKCDHRWILFNEIWTLHITARLDYEKTSFGPVEIIQLWFSLSSTLQWTMSFSWIICNQASSIRRSSKNLSFISNIIRTTKSTITISLIDNIDETIMIVEMNHLIVELNFIEMNLVTIDQMIDFKIVVSRNALYVTNSIVDQSIIQIRSERTRKNDFESFFSIQKQ